MNKQQYVQKIKEELWNVLQQQKISKLINRRKKHYQLL
jgi:(p)ppGpp synthase/HD superfamily hydrolase